MWYDQAYTERRQLFLRSYRFSRKQSTSERIRSYVGRFRLMVRLRFGAVRRARRVLWSGFRRHVSCYGRRRGSRRLSGLDYFGGGDRLEHCSSARDWFGTPCHRAWAGKKGW